MKEAEPATYSRVLDLLETHNGRWFSTRTIIDILTDKHPDIPERAIQTAINYLAFRGKLSKRTVPTEWLSNGRRVTINEYCCRVRAYLWESEDVG